MGDIRKIAHVKPICAVTFTEKINLERVIRELEKIAGPVHDKSEPFEFTYTKYYLDEMGPDLKKIFLSFRNLILPGQLPKIKLETNKIESNWSIEGKRQVNLDPGYITTSKLVLASTKNFAHRIFLSDGIYGDLQMQYRKNKFHFQAWTYPDYQTESAMNFFHKVRQTFAQQVKKSEIN